MSRTFIPAGYVSPLNLYDTRSFLEALERVPLCVS